jgi:hypothetical protein
MEDSSTAESLNYYVTNITGESSSTLLHRLHTNESQLRTLVVILSLTGGLALSFVLGVGIMIYWYFRKCKQKRRLSDKKPSNQDDDEYEDDDEKSFYSYCAACNLMRQQQEEQEQDRSSVSHHESISTASRNTDQQDEIISIPPLPLALLLPTPEPSAPSAKELSHANQNIASSSTSHPEELCHHCLVPPPAYTEK